jgi:hypothetical protein
VGLAAVRTVTTEFSGHASGRHRKIERRSPAARLPIHFCGSGDLEVTLVPGCSGPTTAEAQAANDNAAAATATARTTLETIPIKTPATPAIPASAHPYNSPVKRPPATYAGSL